MRHPVQIKETLWELLNKAAIKESAKQGKVITVAEYVRQVLKRHLGKKE